MIWNAGPKQELNWQAMIGELRESGRSDWFPKRRASSLIISE